jgi:hypothetical protein
MSSTDRPLAAAGLAALVLLLVLSAGTNIHVQFLLLLAGAGCLVASSLPWPLHMNRRELWLVGGVTLLALVIRAWDLLAARALLDEGPFVIGINQIHDDPRQALAGTFYAEGFFTRLYPYLQSLLPPSLAALRWVSVLFGTLTVPALYLLGRWLFDRRIAVIAAVLLATFPPHIHFSRIGINNIADPLFGVLALAFLVRGYSVAAGVMAGMLFYVYEGGQLLFLPLLVICLGRAFARPYDHSPSGADTARSILGFFLGFAVALPVFLAPASDNLLPRIREANLLDSFWQQFSLDWLFTDYWPEHLEPALMHVVRDPDASLFYAGPEALVLPVLVPLLLLGGYAVLRWRSGWLVILWLVLTALGNSLLVNNNWSARFVVAFPALALTLAAGVVWLADRFRRESLRWTVAVLVVLGIVQVRYYFGPHLDDYIERNGYLIGHYDVVYRLRELPAETVVFYNPVDFLQAEMSQHFMDYLGIAHEVRTFDEDHLPLLDQLPPRHSYAFFVTPRHLAYIEWLSYHGEIDGPYLSDRQGIPERYTYALYLAPAAYWRNPPVSSKQ